VYLSLDSSTWASSLETSCRYTNITLLYHNLVWLDPAQPGMEMLNVSCFPNLKLVEQLNEAWQQFHDVMRSFTFFHIHTVHMYYNLRKRLYRCFRVQNYSRIYRYHVVIVIQIETESRATYTLHCVFEVLDSFSILCLTHYTTTPTIDNRAGLMLTNRQRIMQE